MCLEPPAWVSSSSPPKDAVILRNGLICLSGGEEGAVASSKTNSLFWVASYFWAVSWWTYLFYFSAMDFGVCGEHCLPPFSQISWTSWRSFSVQLQQLLPILILFPY